MNKPSLLRAGTGKQIPFVCDVCGSILVENDAEERKQAHLTGKQHTGYERIRESVKEITEKLPKEVIDSATHRDVREIARDRDGSPHHSSSRSRDRYHDDRDRDRDRDRYGGRSSRERDRGYRYDDREYRERDRDYRYGNDDYHRGGGGYRDDYRGRDRYYDRRHDDRGRGDGGGYDDRRNDNGYHRSKSPPKYRR